jgi:hypothetical protein
MRNHRGTSRDGRAAFDAAVQTYCNDTDRSRDEAPRAAAEIICRKP